MVNVATQVKNRALFERLGVYSRRNLKFLYRNGVNTNEEFHAYLIGVKQTANKKFRRVFK